MNDTLTWFDHCKDILLAKSTTDDCTEERIYEMDTVNYLEFTSVSS